MAKAKSILALMIAYLITLLYLAAMATPWWYTRYYSVGQSDDSFYDNNPGLVRDTGLFHRSNCFIDGSCITGQVIYKNNSNLQWVYTTVLVLMILGWIPWLFFMHFLHFRSNKNRSENSGHRVLLAISALLTMAFLLTAVIVFACGFVYNNAVYRHGLYGNRLVTTQGNGLTSIGQHIHDEDNFNNDNGNTASNAKRQIEESISDAIGSVSASVASGISGVSGSVASGISEVSASAASGVSDVSASAASESASVASGISESASGNDNNNNDGDIFGANFDSENGYGNNLGAFTYGSMPWGGSDTALLGAGIPLLYAASGVNANNGAGNGLYWPTPYNGAYNGTLGYKWGANAGWYLTILALILIPLALLLGLLIKTKETIVTTSRTTERRIVNQPTVVQGVQQGVVPQYSQPTAYNQAV